MRVCVYERGKCECGKVRESLRSAIIMFMCAAFLLPFSIFANLHALMLFMRINESSTHAFDCAICRLLYICSVVTAAAAVVVGGSITDIVGDSSSMPIDILFSACTIFLC